MKNKCFWCKGHSFVGVHSPCWKQFKAFMLNDRTGYQAPINDAALDEYIPNGQDYKDSQGRIVEQGQIRSEATGWPEFGEPEY